MNPDLDENPDNHPEWITTDYCDPGILHLDFSSQYWMASTFMRMQEFYESPFPEIRGQYFTAERFMDIYAESKKSKNFTYFTDWAGFNVPGNVVEEFFRLFGDDLSEKEKALRKAICPPPRLGDRYYVIGTARGCPDALQHEIGHALYYLDQNYKRDMDDLLSGMPDEVWDGFAKYLTRSGYDLNVFPDEMQACLLEQDNFEAYYGFGIPKKAKAFPKRFRKALREHKIVLSKQR